MWRRRTPEQKKQARLARALEQGIVQTVTKDAYEQWRTTNQFDQTGHAPPWDFCADLADEFGRVAMFTQVHVTPSGRQFLRLAFSTPAQGHLMLKNGGGGRAYQATTTTTTTRVASQAAGVRMDMRRRV